MTKLGSSITAVARRAPLVVLTALATHAVVYRSLLPADGAHGYFSWYTPLATGLSALSIVGLPLVLAVALLGGRESSVVRGVARIVPRHKPDRPLRAEIALLASGSLGFLAVQETLEHSLELGRVALPSFAPASWLILVAAIAIFAVGSAWVGRAVSSLVDVVRRATEATRVRSVSGARPRGLPALSRRPRPLAVHGGLRAPPVSS